MISIDLAGDPVPQQRPRYSSRGKHFHTYDPCAEIKEKFRWQIKSQYREEPLTAPLNLTLIFYMPIPKSTSGIRKRQMLNGVIHHIKKPDIDNLEKFCLDCMNKIVFEDDSQIVELTAKKVYSTKPGTLIRIEPLHSNKEVLDAIAT